jgi:hypothetical protein
LAIVATMARRMRMPSLPSLPSLVTPISMSRVNPAIAHPPRTRKTTLWPLAVGARVGKRVFFTVLHRAQLTVMAAVKREPASSASRQYLQDRHLNPAVAKGVGAWEGADVVVVVAPQVQPET